MSAVSHFISWTYSAQSTHPSVEAPRKFSLDSPVTGVPSSARDTDTPTPAAHGSSMHPPSLETASTSNRAIRIPLHLKPWLRPHKAATRTSSRVQLHELSHEEAANSAQRVRTAPPNVRTRVNEGRTRFLAILATPSNLAVH